MRRDAAYLLDILEAARLAVQYASGKSREEFLADVQCQDAVLRRLILIGEAARRVSPETKAEHSRLPWSEMVSMRNLVIHEYEDIDLFIVWDTANRDLPQLISLLEGIFDSSSWLQDP